MRLLRRAVGVLPPMLGASPTSRALRRRPAAAVGLAATFLLVLTIAGTILLLNMQHKHRELAVLADLKEVADYQEHAKWNDAQTALQRADARLEGSNPANLRSQIAVRIQLRQFGTGIVPIA